VAFHVGLYAFVADVAPPLAAAAPLATVLTIAWLPAGPLKTLEREKRALFAGYPAYLKYVMRTSALLPLPPGLYAFGWERCPGACAALCEA
jgi:hypothetical protein